MPRTCTICTHEQRAEIDRALVGGEPFRNIAERFGTSATALTRHKAEHVPAKLAQAHEAKEVAQASTLLDDVRALRGKAVSILLAAEKSGDLRTALLGIREARACIELLAEMEGELNRRPEVHLHVSPAWIEVRTVIINALGSYPDARASVAAALLEVQP